MSDGKMGVVSWISIVISIIIAFCGITFGIIRGQSLETAAINRTKIDANTIRITALEMKFERIDERLTNIQTLLEKHMEK